MLNDETAIVKIDPAHYEFYYSFLTYFDTNPAFF